MASSPETKEARRALSRHLYHHHSRDTDASGTLGDRLTYHDDLHWNARQAGVKIPHTHATLRDGETEHDLAHRYLDEGTDASLPTMGSE